MSAGVLSVWGQIGRVSPPNLVLPLIIEPSKPRLCHDERYLNLWIKDLPFKLDHLSDLPKYVLPGHYQTTFDEKSGYQHVYLHPSSRTFSACTGRVFTLHGKTVSFSLAIASCKLYLRESFKAVSGLVRKSKPAIKVTGLLRSELGYSCDF